ncbi:MULTISPECIES: hypothetical protein [Aeromicrobium]|uniref:hypothetical protein n=1 Tax=Aeromicrobium TaxID=2040 RepID=UPI000A524CD9|nr:MULTISPECIES: hypothetical protein [Aeromicrobium]MCL8250091.1 hypothetical protein [Aeromicrobium fastidiosum]
MTRRSRPVRLAVVVGLALAGLTALPSSSVADGQREGRYPGLPYVECIDYSGNNCSLGPDTANDYGWLNTAQNGLAGSPAAKQWISIPTTVLAVNATFDIQIVDPQPGFTFDQLSPAYSRAFFVSPTVSDDTYGDTVPIVVRTVAFGSIPVEVTLQVSQRRTAEDLPIPIQLNTLDERKDLEGGGFTEIVHPTSIEDTLNVRIRKVVVDGVDTQLDGTCETGPTAAISAASGRFERTTPPDWTPPEGSEGAASVLQLEYDPAEAMSALLGGTLRGTLDIPSFRHCTTKTGDDLSPLLTSAVSGPDNPVVLQVGALSCAEYDDQGRSRPPAPGTTSADLQCFDFYPFNPKIKAKPDPAPIPDHAPGEQPPE